MIGKRIKELRKKIGITQEELADTIKIPRAKIGKLETDRQDVDSELLIGLSEQFGVNVHWLVIGQGEMFGISTGPNIKGEREQELESELIELKTEVRVLREMLSLPATKNKKTA
jgi:transcriptional regulator with XRE-family HTH domain